MGEIDAEIQKEGREVEGQPVSISLSLIWQAISAPLLQPKRYFSRVRMMDLFLLASLLQLGRWMTLSWITMTHFYIHNPPSFFPVPFGIELQDYRFFEIFTYFPFGLALIGFIAYETWLHGRKHAVHPMPFRKVWEVVALAYFAPWFPTLILDNILLALDLAIPLIVVPLHVSVVGVESLLTAIGLQQVFGIPRKMALILGLSGGAIFLALAGIAVR